MAKKKEGFFKRNYGALVLAALALILANAAYYAFTHYEGPSMYGDDPTYLYLAGAVVQGVFRINPGFIFSVRLMQFLPIAITYLLLGVNNLSSSLWDIVSYLGLIVVTFLIVRLKYNDRAALLSAFLVSVFPLMTQFSVNVSEDPPLAFVGALSLYLLMLAEKDKDRLKFFSSGLLLAVAWLISYEAAIVIAFVLLYALVELLRKKLSINRDSLFVIYGVAAPLILVFIYSAATINMPFAVFTVNSRFYSAIGTAVNGGPTIPSANTDLSYYTDLMFQYRLLSVITGGALQGLLQRLYVTFFAGPQNYEYGVYFYLFVPIAAALLVLRERRAYFFMAWFAFVFLLLEFGPMHVGISLNPFHITYLPTHRLERFIIPAVPAIAAVIGIGLDRMLAVKGRDMQLVNIAAVALLLGFLYVNNYYISEFHYWWMRYPQLIVMQPADFLRFNASVDRTAPIYIEAFFNGTTTLISYTGANFPFYVGRPTGQGITAVSGTESCSTFAEHSYVVWSGRPHCGNWVNLFNVTMPTDVPPYFIYSETPTLVSIPTNVYYVG